MGTFFLVLLVDSFLPLVLSEYCSRSLANAELMMRKCRFSPIRTSCGSSLLACLILSWAGAFSMVAAAEFQVNTYTTYDQSAPAVAVDAMGTFVVVWESRAEDNGYDGVFGQRYDSTGTAMGSEFHVNTYTARRQGNPAVAADGAGNFVVVWSSERQDGDSFGVFGQRYDSTGTPHGQEFQVNSYTTSYQGNPAVAADATGNFVVVWAGYGEWDYSGVFGQRYDSAGTPRGQEFKVNTYTTGPQTAPAIAGDGAGNFVVVWSSYGQESDYFGVFGQRYDSAGTPQGGEFQVNSSTIYFDLGEAAPAPAVAMDADGDSLVVWNSFDDEYEFGVFGQRYDSSGAAQGGEFQVNSAPICSYYYPGDPALAADAAGNFVIVWEGCAEDSAYYGVFGRRYDSSGAAQGNEFQINSTDLSFSGTDDFGDPAIAADGNGNFVVVWENYEQDGDGDGVFALLALCGSGVLDPGEHCDDGNTTGGDGCDAGCNVDPCFTCSGEPSACTPVTCPDDANPCTDDACDPAMGCVHLPNTRPCDDASPCTAGDACTGGTCRPGEPVACPDDANPCTDDVCDPATGACFYTAKADGTGCSNGTGCEANTGDICRAGHCADAAACSAAEVVYEQEVVPKRPRLKLTCFGESRKDYCTIRGFTAPAPGTMFHSGVATARVPAAAEANEVPVTKKIRRHVNRPTGKVEIELGLNRVGRWLLRQAFKQGQALDVRVHVDSHQASKTASLDYLVKLVNKRKSQ